MAEGFKDHFASVSRDYATFRPTYPHALFEWLGALAPARSLVWDCGTGSGQAARALADHFDRVIATDASHAQLARALTHPRVEYRVASAEDSGLASESADLVTVAQALHWFETERFFAECDRVLVPGGVLGVWTYGPLQVENTSVDRIVRDYYQNIVGPFWPPERALVDSGFASLDFPYPLFETPPFSMEACWTLPELLGYLGTWTATVAYRETVERDPLDLIEHHLAGAWPDPRESRRITWPLTVLAGRRTVAGL